MKGAMQGEAQRSTRAVDYKVEIDYNDVASVVAARRLCAVVRRGVPQLTNEALKRRSRLTRNVIARSGASRHTMRRGDVSRV